jgi:hypothetical protein
MRHETKTFTNADRAGTVAAELDPRNALRADVRVTMASPARVLVTAQSTNHNVATPSSLIEAREHCIVLIGLRPSTDYTVTVRALTETGISSVGRPVRLRSGALPDDFPAIDAYCDGDRMAPGFTLLSLTPSLMPVADQGACSDDGDEQLMFGYLVIVDDRGYVVWYHRIELSIEDAKQLPNGDLIVNCDDCITRQINILGETVREWTTNAATDIMPYDQHGRPRANPDAIHVPAHSMHHEVSMLPEGNLLFLSTELREIHGSGNGPCAGVDRYEVIGDVVVEADSLGNIVGEWRVLDVLDPICRPGTHLCTGGRRTVTPAIFYPSAEFPRDWSHANAVTLDRRRNALLISLRHLDAIIAVRYSGGEDGPAGELLWELGHDGNMTLESGSWPYHQHAVKLQEDGSILLYDNGEGGPRQWAEGKLVPLASRAVIFEIDGSARTGWKVRQRWEFRLHDGRVPIFCRRLGDASRLQNGNVLISHGNIMDDSGRVSGRVVEVVPEGRDGGSVVFDLEVYGESVGWCVYRASRISSLTPAAETVKTATPE